MEDAVDTHHAKNDVAGIGRDFDDDFATAVKGTEDLLYLGLFVVFNGDDDFLNVMLFDEGLYVLCGAEAGHDGSEAFLVVERLHRLVAVDRDEADEDIARVFLLILKVEISLVGFVVAADEEGGEADESLMDVADDVGGLNDTAGVCEGQMYKEEEDGTQVVVAIGANFVVEHDSEEENHHADECGDNGVLSLF